MLQSKALNSFVDLLFPRTCISCSSHLDFYEKMLCLNCQLELPQTGFHLEKENPLFKKLLLNFPLENAAALFGFQKEGSVARMIHQFKYNKQVNIGRYFGKWLGYMLLESPFFKSLDAIIPVPLHPSKQRTRGFNQAEIIAEPLAKQLQIPLVNKSLKRVKKTKPLAKINHDARWKEVDEAFTIKQPLPKSFEHLLLVDDVITTGATLNACARTLLKNSQIKLSIVSLACRL